MGCGTLLHSAWRRATQITNYHGQYSIERMCELREYCQQKSMWRALLVLLLSVVPSLTTIVGLDSMPLQDPYSGWDKNSVMWIRVFVATVILSNGALLQLRAIAPGLELTVRHCVPLSVLLAIVHQVAVMLIAKYWVFPVPFMRVLGNPPWSLTLLLSVTSIVGREKLNSTPHYKQQIQRFSKLVNLSSFFLVVFPVYTTIFRSLAGVNQFAFIFVLPVLKFLLKKATRRIVADVDELVPVVVITVDLFNALFQAKCMQTSASVWTAVGIITIDVIQSVYSLRKLFRYMADVQELVRQENGSPELFEHCVALLRRPQLLNLRVLRVRSVAQAHLSADASAMLQKLKDLSSKDSQNVLATKLEETRSSGHYPSKSFTCTRLAAVVPWSPAAPLRPKQQATINDVVPFRSEVATSSPSLLDAEQRTLVLKKTLELLWKCESVLLVEYIETAVPLLYGLSLSILYHLPNAKYYPGVAEMTPKKLNSTVASILVYSVLELVSLVYLHVALKWRFQISALHQLAFVLEKQWMSVQGVFLTWVIVVLGFTLVHYGMCMCSFVDPMRRLN